MIKLISDFFQQPGGVAVFVLALITLCFILIDLSYRAFSKIILDGVFALIILIITSPVFLVCALISRSRTGAILEKEAYLGYRGKIIYLHSFACMESGIRNLPRLLDVLCGRLSFVGVKPLNLSDGAFISGEYSERFNARPGIFCHLALNGGENITYKEMFISDARYARRRELLNDAAIMFMCALKAVCGKKKSYLGEARSKSYAETLKDSGKITQTDCEQAARYAEEAVLENSKTMEFKNKNNFLSGQDK